MRNKLIYFPSFSVGSFGGDLMKDYKIKDLLPIRFYAEESYKNDLLYPYFLITGGHFYKKQNIKEIFGFDDNTLVMGDSGGFQIATGVLKMTKELPGTILKWLEESSNIAINLDIPPIDSSSSTFNSALEISYNNFKYFYENQSGKVKFLNVLHGNNNATYTKWYNTVKDFDFYGWSVGSSSSNSVYKLIESILVLLKGKEHLKQNNEYLHILGTSKILDFAILCQLQKSLNDVGSNMTITTDSSTPSRQVVYGGYHVAPDFKRMNFNMIHIPKIKDFVSDKKLKWVGYSKIDEILNSVIGFEEIFKFDKDAYNAIVLHNLYVFIETIKIIEIYIENRPYLVGDYNLFNTDVEKLLNIVDDIIKSDNPTLTFEKNKPFIMSISRLYDQVDVSAEKINEFFKF